jgi:hypothetical protein
MASRLVVLAGVALVMALAPPARPEVLLTESVALKRAFPDATVERRTLYLSEDEVAEVESAARSRLPSPVVTVYEARSGGALVGRAVLDTHTVRTMSATVLTAIAPDGTVGKVLVLQFAEPADYLPRESWLKTLGGRALDDELWPGRGVNAVSGATLTVHAFTDAVRRALALDALVLRSDR